MSSGNAVKIRDAIIIAAIILNVAFVRWRASRVDNQPVKAITSLPASEIIGNPSNELGDPNARYLLVEFGDYQGPPCARLFPE